MPPSGRYMPSSSERYDIYLRGPVRPPLLFSGAPGQMRWASASGRCRTDSPIAGWVGEKHFFSRIGAIRFGTSRAFPARTRSFWGLRPQAPAYFSLAGKVGKRAHRGGTLSMGSLPYEPLPRDDTKGDARPPLETPAGEAACPGRRWILPGVRLTGSFIGGDREQQSSGKRQCLLKHKLHLHGGHSDSQLLLAAQ